MSDGLAHLRREKTSGFETCLPENDFILSRDHSPPGLENETYWFSFDVPERCLTGSVYFWVHTQLRTLSCFVLIWQGEKRYYHQAEHLNYHQFLPYPEVTDDTVTAAEIGVKIRIIEPHARHEITYADPDTGTTLHLHTRAVMPAVKAIGRAHLDQVMHVTGELVLDGEKILIDSYSVRDRSWRGKRPEQAPKFPPITFASGASMDGKTAFNFCGADDPDKGAPWAGMYDIANDQLLLEGWLYRDGALKKIVKMSKVTEYERGDFLRALSWEAELEDDTGHKYLIRARRQAAIPFAPWSNMFMDWQQLSFKLDGVSGYCMSNDMLWNEHAKRMPLVK